MCQWAMRKSSAYVQLQELVCWMIRSTSTQCSGRSLFMSGAPHEVCMVDSQNSDM